MEEYGDGRVFSFKQPRPIQVELELFENDKIDFYTIGVYACLKYALENNLPTEWLLKRGSEEYINKAFDKLIEHEYIERTEE